VNRTRFAALALAVLLFAAAGCITSGRQLGRLASSAVPGSTERAHCEQARAQGWCSPQCYRRLPVHCSGAGMTLISCNSEGMCTWWADSGALVYGFSPAAVSSAAPYAPRVKLTRRQRIALRLANTWYAVRDWATGEAAP
jgi:hypothetical protein